MMSDPGAHLYPKKPAIKIENYTWKFQVCTGSAKTDTVYYPRRYDI